MSREKIIVEAVYAEAHGFDGYRTIGWRSRIGNKILVGKPFKSQVIEWLKQEYPGEQWEEKEWGVWP